MWHVVQTSSIILKNAFIAHLLDLVCDGRSWYVFPQIYSHIAFWGTDCSKHFELKRIGLFAATIVALFYLLALYLFFISKIQKHFSFSACSETLLKSTCQHLLLLVGFDTLTYRKDYDRPPILVGHQMVGKRNVNGVRNSFQIWLTIDRNLWRTRQRTFRMAGALMCESDQVFQSVPPYTR